MKKLIHKIITGASIVCLTLISFGANAELVGRLADGDGNFQAYYDTDADLTWLADLKYAQGSSYDLDGTGQDDGYLNWTAATDWTAQLDIDGVTGWRLATGDPDAVAGTYTSVGELANMWLVLGGGAPGTKLSDNGNAYYDLFQNYGGYTWTSTLVVDTQDRAWANNWDYSYQYNRNVSAENVAWAVRDGDVSAVPIPAAAWLFGSGLLGLVGIARRKT